MRLERLKLDVPSKSSTRSMRLSCVFPSGLSKDEMQDAANSLVAGLPDILSEQSSLLDDARPRVYPLTYVFVPSRGWLPDIKLIQEQALKATKKTRKQKPKRGATL
jgi:hypothetical protein